MNHQDVQARLSEYLEGDLPLRQRALVDAHLDGCSACREDLIELRHTVRTLRSLGDALPAAAIADAVMERIRAGEGAPSWWRQLVARLEDLTQPRVVRPAALCALGVVTLLVLRPELMHAVTQRLGGRAPAPPAEVSISETIQTAQRARPAAAPLHVGARSEDAAPLSRGRVVWMGRGFGAGGPIELLSERPRRHVGPILSAAPLVAEGPLFGAPPRPDLPGFGAAYGFGPPLVRQASAGGR